MLSKIKEICDFESGLLQRLCVPIIIKAARQFQNLNIFHFLKAVHYENYSKRQIFTANHRIERHPGHQNYHRNTPIRQSKLMQAYIEYLKSHVDNCNIIYIDFMDLAFEEIKEYHALHAYVEAQYQANKVNYLFVDEVQMCPQFELAINSLYAKEKYDIYLTGSNAFLLSAIWLRFLQALY